MIKDYNKKIDVDLDRAKRRRKLIYIYITIQIRLLISGEVELKLNPALLSFPYDSCRLTADKSVQLQYQGNVSHLIRDKLDVTAPLRLMNS